jgi:G:T-mismatch repair DNA endonuclease (very short patch repair protein)
LVAAFAEIGIECLVVWESEVKKTPVETKERIKAFLGVIA